MKTRLHSFAVLSVVALSTLALAAEGFVIARKPKANDVHRYTVSGEIEMRGITLPYKGKLEEKVTKVDVDGTYTLEQRELELKLIAGTQELDQPVPAPATTVFLPNGLVKTIEGNDAKPESYRMSNLELIYDPGKPLAVGDTWTYEIKANKETGAVAAKAEYKLLAEEKLGTHETLKIQAKVKETEGATPGQIDSTVWLDKADGSMVKSDMKWTNVPLPGSQGPITGTMKIEIAEGK